MESLGVFPDGEWGSFSAIFSSDELETPRFLSDFSSPAPVCVDSPANIGGIGANKSWFYSLDATDFNLSKQGYSHSCISSSTPQPNDISLFIDMDSVGEQKAGSFLPFLTDVLEEDHRRTFCFHGDMDGDGNENLYYNHPASTAIDSSYEEQGFKRKFNGGVVNTISSDNPKKKTRVTQPVKSRKTVDSSKPTFKIKKNCSKTSVEDDGNGGSEGQSSSTCSTADDNASQETNGGSSSDSKTRAERGSATDPQSLYARKRRERINERLRILQKLVPNGTKVDISTMLEEAVHYVKFLQLQIKLLSSDDHWMYAPIAYNGMDIGLHQKISPILFH